MRNPCPNGLPARNILRDHATLSRFWNAAQRIPAQHRGGRFSSPLHSSTGNYQPSLPRTATGRAFQSAYSPSKNQRIPEGPLARLHLAPLRAGFERSTVLLAVAAVALASIVSYYLDKEQDLPSALSIDNPPITDHTFDIMTSEILPGRPGNLTAEQEEKLRELWARIFQLCGVLEQEEVDDSAPASSNGKPDAEKKKRRNIFSRKGKKDSEESKSPTAGLTQSVKNGEDDKYGQNKAFLETVANQSPESIRETIWNMVKHDHPDALLLRFLRARKWDVEKALVMLISTMKWRATEMHVDESIMVEGEGRAAEQEREGDQAAKKLATDFLAQMRMGKSFLHGQDKDGRPICIVRVRLHHQGDQVEESLERYTVYLIETARFMVDPPIDTATIVFDMTGFSMANMDYTPVKFMIKCFEANFPESLGIVVVHKAPWIFQGIWKMIRGWLDPVVAAKVNFTNSTTELEQFIPPSQIIKELGGQEDWDYEYVEPVEGENSQMKDTETRDKLLEARQLLYKEYEAATTRWIEDPNGEHAQTTKQNRNEIAKRLREDYWKVDPYIRARSLYDRIGVLGPGGKLNFYSKKALGSADATSDAKDVSTNGTIVGTSADDVD